jgi:hypothetical protein
MGNMIKKILIYYILLDFLVSIFNNGNVKAVRKRSTKIVELGKFRFRAFGFEYVDRLASDLNSDPPFCKYISKLHPQNSPD